MEKEHHYAVQLRWTGNLNNEGTRSYQAYSRNHLLSAKAKPDIPASSDPAFRGDPGRYNPEELLVMSLASCHMLWFLHLCASAGIVVAAYTDAATGRMEEAPDGSGRFTEVVLHPEITLHPPVDKARLAPLQAEAHQKCFIANSCNFPVRVEPLYHLNS